MISPRFKSETQEFLGVGRSFRSADERCVPRILGPGGEPVSNVEKHDSSFVGELDLDSEKRGRQLRLSEGGENEEGGARHRSSTILASAARPTAAAASCSNDGVATLLDVARKHWYACGQFTRSHARPAR